MLKDVEVLRNDGMLDVEALERYVVDDLDEKNWSRIRKYKY